MFGMLAPPRLSTPLHPNPNFAEEMRQHGRALDRLMIFSLGFIVLSFGGVIAFVLLSF
jgi:hypothetical protein